MAIDVIHLAQDAAACGAQYPCRVTQVAPDRDAPVASGFRVGVKLSRGGYERVMRNHQIKPHGHPLSAAVAASESPDGRWQGQRAQLPFRHDTKASPPLSERMRNVVNMAFVLYRERCFF